jgi:ribosomal protein S18 acetylase RimI-like enzyme
VPTKPRFTLRRARAADVRAILPLMVEFNRHEEIAWDPRAGAPALRKLLRSPRIGFAVLAVDGTGTALGYAIVTWGFDLEWNGPDSFLTELYVGAGARGGGVGAALLAEAERLARRGGARAIHLMVRHENRAARALYRKSGYIAPRRLLLTKPLPKS